MTEEVKQDAARISELERERDERNAMKKYVYGVDARSGAEAEVARVREALEPQMRAAFRAGVARAVASTDGFEQTHPSEDEWVSRALAGQEGGGDGR